MNKNIRAIIKSLLSYESFTLKKISNEFTKITGKKYTPDSVTGKLKRETFSLKEAYILADILGYELEFKKK